MSPEIRQNTDQSKKSIYLKNHTLDSSDFLHEVKYQRILKTDSPKILKKKIDHLAEGRNGLFRAQKMTFWKKALKRFVRFLLFLEQF